MRSLRLGLLALALAVPLVVTGPTSARIEAGCSVSKITPVLQNVTINQGLQTYSALARGKETLVRLYMSLPSCAVAGQSVRIDAVTLAASLKDAATGASVDTKTFTPTPALSSSALPQITNLSTLTEMSPSDPVFIIPGNFLAPSTDPARLTLTISASLNWTPINPSGTSVTGTSYTSNAAGTSMSKTVEVATRALRLLIVPMGNSLLDSAGTTAVQNGLTTLSREYPVPDGTGSTGVRVGSLIPPSGTSPVGGIRFAINNAYLDLTAAPISATMPFCGTPSIFGTSASGQIDQQLAQIRQSWNTANAATPSYQADNVVGAIGENNSTGSATNPNCDEARAAVNGRESWVRAVSDKTTALALDMNLTSRTLSYVPTTAFPTTYPFSVLVDNEVINVTGATSGVSNSWDVTRGAAAVHTSGATVTLLSTTGALMAMEIEHNYGYVPLSRGDANNHSLWAHADHNSGDGFRGYNVTGRQFLPDNRSNMRFSPPGWTNLTTLLEPQDWSDLLCNLGGNTTTECTTAGTTGTSAAGAAPSPVPSFVMTGTTNGTSATVLESYTATTLPTPDDPTSAYHVTQYPSNKDDKIPVSFAVSDHSGSATDASSSTGFFSVAVPLDKDNPPTRIELRKFNGPVLYSVSVQRDAGGNVVVPTVSVPQSSGFRALAAAKRTRPHARHRAGQRTRRLMDVSPVKTITADQTGTACQTKANEMPPGGIGVGIAFDGSHLLVSCWTDNTISVINPSDGSQAGEYTVTSSNQDYAMNTLGALAYDITDHVIWACNALNDVGTIDPSTHVFTKKFTSKGCLDGLAYDSSDNTLWTSPDATSEISHYKADGTLLNDTPYTPSLGADGNSGIAVGGDTLYLANDGGSQIYTSTKTFSTPAQLFATLPNNARAEDMECDNVTFLSQGETVLWSVNAYTRTLYAWQIPNGSCKFGGGSGGIVPGTITYTVNSPAANVTSDIFLTCPGSTVYNVVRVAVPGKNVSIPQTVGCSGGEFYAKAYDGFSSSPQLTPVAPSTMSNPPTLPFTASISSPYPGQSYSVNDDISLVGSAFDYSTGTNASLQWFDNGSPIANATGEQVDVRASTLGAGMHNITLQATSGGKTTTSPAVSITISNDADGDGIPAPEETVIHDCAVSKGITTDGGDNDPTNGSKDYDNDGIPNRDDPFPCTPQGSYMAAAAIFFPSKLSLTNTTSLSASGILVPFRDMTQVSVPRNQLPPVFIKQIDLGEQGTIDVNEQASAYAASGSIGAATFGTQPLVGILSNKGIVNRSINLVIQGTGNDPLSGPWTFTAIVSTYVIP